MIFELFIGCRYLRAKKKKYFVSAFTIISTVGVMIGVFSMIVVLSVMNGFRADITSKILGMSPSLKVVYKEGALSQNDNIVQLCENIDGVSATAPYLSGNVMLVYGERASGAILKGINSSKSDKVINLSSFIKEGDLSGLSNDEIALPLIIGNEIARSLGIVTGAEIRVIAPEGRLTPIGRIPYENRFKIIGIFDAGMHQFDSAIAITSLGVAQNFLGHPNKISGLELKVEKHNQVGMIKEDLLKRIDEKFSIISWEEANKNLINALNLEKIAMFIILSMIVIVGALNIINGLVMTVMNKHNDIAILKSLGVSSLSIIFLFIIQGLIIGSVGTLTGLAVGLILCHAIAVYNFLPLPEDIFYLVSLPVEINTSDIVTVILAAMMISLLATIYPSWYASKLNPVEAMRYE